MSRTIEAKAIITGEDRLSGVIQKAAGNVNASLAQMGKGAKISADLDRLNRSLANTKRQLEAVGKVNAAQERLNSAKLGMSGANAQAERIAAQLAAARKANDAATTAALVAQQKDASRAVAQATRAVEKQGGALSAAKQELAAFGVPITNLAAHENALRASADKTTAAIQRETAALKRREQVAEAEARRRSASGLPIPAAVPSTRGKPPVHDHGGGAGVAEAVTGMGMLRFGAAAAGIGGGAYLVGDQVRQAARSSMDFERAMIEVGKATDTQGGELDAYGEKLLKLARQTGKTKEQLASMLSSAGFAGRPKDELLAFTEYAAKATVAWGTTAEETGQSMAELGNIYGASQKRIEEMGDAINAMADNSASRESDLLEFLRRAGASGKASGIAAEQMLAFGAAMKEVGVRNETAGTAMEALLNVMKLGDKFGKPAAKAFKELGLSSDKMRKSFVAKPVETLIGLLEKLNTVADPLKKAEIMTNLVGKEYQDDLAKVLNALPQLTKYLGIMGDKAQIAKAGVRFQFAQNLDKDVVKIERAQRAIDELYKRAGDPIKSRLGDMAEALNQAAERLEGSMGVFERAQKERAAYREGLGLPKEPTVRDAPDMSKEPTFVQEFYRRQGQMYDYLLGRAGKREEDELAARSAGFARAQAEKAAARQATLDRPAEIEAKIERQRELQGRSQRESGQVTGMRRSAALNEAKRAEAQIATLQGELAKARDAIAALRAQEHRDRGAFGLDGPAAAPQGTIGPGRFGFGLHGTDVAPARNVPLPPMRPVGLPTDGGMVAPAPVAAPARIESLAPVQVTGEVNETVQHQHQHTINLNTDMLDARIKSVAAQTVKSIPLSSGARAGSVSMPGAAATPGAAPNLPNGP